MIERRAHRIEGVRPLTADVFVLRVERMGFPVRAGQHVTLGLHGGGTNREYSIYSAEQDPGLEFLLKVREGSVIGSAARQCRPGDRVDLAGPFGHFALPESGALARRYLFVATGVGIAPFHSFVGTHPALDYRLIHGIRREADGYDAESYDPQRYTACLSAGVAVGAAGARNPEPLSNGRRVFQGRVTDYLRNCPVSEGTLCYICGGHRMISEVFDILRAQRVPSNDILTEVFN